MSLHKKIENDLREAQLAKDSLKTSVLRFLKASLINLSIEKKTDQLSDELTLQVIQRQIKQHKESIDQFKKANRTDLVSKEGEELKILESYLPQQLTDGELSAIVQSAVKSTGAKSKKEFGLVMKEAMKETAGRADGKKISQMVNKAMESLP